MTAPTTHVVYRAYSADDGCLYVGCTTDLKRRMREHKRTSAWFPAMARIVSSEPMGEGLARSEERRLIRELSPLYNVRARVSGDTPPVPAEVQAAMRDAINSLTVPAPA